VNVSCVYMYEYLPSYARTYVSSGESVVKDGDWALLFIIIEDFAHIQYQKAPVSICRCTTVDQQHLKQCGIQREFTMRAVFFGIFIASNALNSVECALTQLRAFEN
jgi:hypothetical protein